MVEPHEVGAVGRRGQQEHPVEDLPGDHLRARAHEGPQGQEPSEEQAFDQGRPSRPARRQQLETGQEQEDPVLPAQAHGEPEEQSEEQIPPGRARLLAPVPDEEDEGRPASRRHVGHDRLLGHVPVEERGEPEEQCGEKRHALREVAPQEGVGHENRREAVEKAAETHGVDVDVAVAREVDVRAGPGLDPAHHFPEKEEGDRHESRSHREDRAPEAGLRGDLDVRSGDPAVVGVLVREVEIAVLGEGPGVDVVADAVAADTPAGKMELGERGQKEEDEQKPPPIHSARTWAAQRQSSRSADGAATEGEPGGSDPGFPAQIEERSPAADDHEGQLQGEKGQEALGHPLHASLR